MRRIYLIIVFCHISVLKLSAQNIPINFSILNDYLRREQVIGNINPDFSFNFRPILVEKAFPGFHSPFLNETFEDSATINSELKSKKIKISPLPIQLITVFNSSHPYGWGNGALGPAKGIQTLISAGAHLKYGKLSIQLYPQFHYAQNLPFEEYPENAPLEYFTTLRRDVRGTEKPVRFTNQPIIKALPGNSNILFNYGSFATGISTENINWGPGQFNSLHISANAEGFLHGTIKTTRPAKTFLGNFEGYYFMGKLEGYGGPYFSDSTSINLLPLKQEESFRYFTGFSISYNPKWVKGLSIGASRTFQIYREDMEDNFRAWFPLFDPLPKDGTGVIENILLREDQHFSVFSRWILKEAKFEFYFEYLRNDHSLNWRDFILNPEHSRAYLLGFSKGWKISEQKNYFLRTEYTHTQAPINNIVRAGGEDVGVYYNGQVVQGLTNRGEVLGSGVGQSGNHLVVELRKSKKMNSVGVILERVAREQNFYVKSTYSNLKLLPWVDFSSGVFVEHVKTRFIFSGNVKGIVSKNYNWLPNNTNSFGDTAGTHFNINSTLNFIYIF